ncbi:MAG: hypothetical protein HQ575_04385 [Candidatus Omnitrophica bacterium]|nr:hypothetical protein [Candidatus Omnitrophota bacterium]
MPKLEQFKYDFISVISHELRTPLAIIKEGISLILDEIPGKINSDQKEILIMSKNNVNRLAKSVDDMLITAKMKKKIKKFKKEKRDE